MRVANRKRLARLSLTNHCEKMAWKDVGYTEMRFDVNPIGVRRLAIRAYELDLDKVSGQVREVKSGAIR
jgi:hypothetical protein